MRQRCAHAIKQWDQNSRVTSLIIHVTYDEINEFIVTFRYFVMALNLLLSLRFKVYPWQLLVILQWFWLIYVLISCQRHFSMIVSLWYLELGTIYRGISMLYIMGDHVKNWRIQYTETCWEMQLYLLSDPGS